MRRSTVISIFGALVFAIVAVFGMREFLTQQVALLSNGQSEPAVTISTLVVAAHPMRFGKVVEAQSLKEINWPDNSIPQGAYRTIAELLDKEGKPRYVMSAIEKNEPVLATKITGAGQRATLSAALSQGMKAVSIRVNDVLGVSGFVLPGDRVDIMLTRQQGDSSNKAQLFTDVLLQGVRVLAIDQSADDRSDEPSVVRTVTFEVSTIEAQKLTLAANVGTLSLALRNVASAATEEVQAININDLGGGPTAQALLQEQIASLDVERLVDDRIGKIDQRIESIKKAFSDSQPKPSPQVASGPSFAKIGVYRGAEARVEYKVKKQGDEDDISLVNSDQKLDRLVRNIKIER